MILRTTGDPGPGSPHRKRVRSYDPKPWIPKDARLPGVYAKVMDPDEGMRAVNIERLALDDMAQRGYDDDTIAEWCRRMAGTYPHLGGLMTVRTGREFLAKLHPLAVFTLATYPGTLSQVLSALAHHTSDQYAVQRGADVFAGLPPFYATPHEWDQRVREWLSECEFGSRFSRKSGGYLSSPLPAGRDPALMRQLASAMKKGGAAKRSDLRRLYDHVMAAEGYTDADAVIWLDSATTSIRDAVPRLTLKGLRDALSVRALSNIVFEGKDGVRRMVEAMQSPGTCGVASYRGTTGYEIGSHQEMWGDDVAHYADLLASKGETKAMIEAMKTKAKALAARKAAPATTPATAAAAPTTTTKTKTGETIMTTETTARFDLVETSSHVLLSAMARVMAELKLDAEAVGECMDLIHDGAAVQQERVKSLVEYVRDASTEADLDHWKTFDLDGSKEDQDERETIVKELLRVAKTSKDPFGGETPFGEGEASEAEAEEEAEGETPATLGKPASDKAALINMAMGVAGLPPVEKLIEDFNQMVENLAQARREMKAIEKKARDGAYAPTAAPSAEGGKGDIPAGKVVWKKAATVFGLSRGKDAFSFEVPVWEWDHAHPHVPEADPDYIFRPFELMHVLIGVLQNKPTYLTGHTGTGKTTLVQQVAARLNWPFFRINFDSEITRLDLIGRDVLEGVGGITTSRFVDGVIPLHMSQPYMVVYDEFDFIRPDVAYVMQRVLENDALVLTEDGGRVVRPHAMHRIFATGNTVGQGDEHGMYQGARPQSLALLDRFTNWVHVDYLEADDRRKLVLKAAPSLDEASVNMVCQYITEHLEAFTTSKVVQPLSPRGYMELAARIETMTRFFPKSQRQAAIKTAFDATILHRANNQDRVVLDGIIKRVIRSA